METEATTSPRRDHFLALSVAYLAIPCLIFMLGWVRQAIGITAALVVAGCVAWLGWQKQPATRPALARKLLLLVLPVAFLWTLFVGVGGVLPQGSDYMKHNLLFHDLTSSSWPVKYPHAGGGTYLCYAVGYYLVPALGGRVLGVEAIRTLTFLWTFAGLALFFWWAATVSKSPRVTIAAILLFAPTAILWALFKSHGLPGVITAAALEPKLLYGGLLFNGFDSFTRFNYTPQHALTGWLGTAVLYEMLWARKIPRGAIFVWALCVFWSPLTSLGLLLVPLAAWQRVRWRDYIEPLNLLGGGGLLVILAIYFQGHLPLPDKGFIGTFLPGSQWLLYYALFLILMFLPILFLWLVERQANVLGEWRPLFLGSIIVLLLLPLYKFGIYSDLRLQASAPALLFLALSAVRIMMSEKFTLDRPLCLLLAGGLFIGALLPAGHLLKNTLSNSIDCYSYEHVVKFRGWRSLTDMTDPRFDLASQYQGRGNSPAVRWLLRPTPGPNP